MKKEDPNFKGFYMGIPYLQRIRKMLNDHAEIIAQIPIGSIGEEERVIPDGPELDVTLEVEEDEPTKASWVTKGNKRQKIVHIPKKVK